MERRRELRIACYQRAGLTELTKTPRRIACRVVELSGRGMRIVADEPIQPGPAVSIESSDWIAFGEVCYARREYSHYAMGLQLDQAISGLRELDALRRNRLNDGAGRPSLSCVLDKTQQPVA